MDKVGRTLLLVAILGCLSHASGKKVMKAIWILTPLEYKPGLTDPQQIQFITAVRSTTVNLVWGNLQQSGGYDYLCGSKLALNCSSQYPANGYLNSSSSGSTTPSPSPGASTAPASPAAKSPAASPSPKAPSPSPKAPLPSPADVNPYSQAPTPAPAASGRRLLADNTTATSKTYVYLDTTENTTVGAVPWSVPFMDSIVKAVRDSSQAGGPLEKFVNNQTNITATGGGQLSVTLAYINIYDESNTTSPPPASPPAGNASAPAPAPGGIGGGSPSPGASPAASPSPGAAAAPSPSPSGSSNSSTDGGAVGGATGASSSGGDSSGGSSSKTTVIIIVVACAVGVAIIAAVVGTCVIRKRRSQKEKISAELLVHRWKKEREEAAAYRAKVDGTASGRSPFDRAASIRGASALGSKTLAHEDFKSFRSTSDRTQRSQLGLGRWASNSGRGDNPRSASSPVTPPPTTGASKKRQQSPPDKDPLDDIDLELNTVLDRDHTRSADIEMPPQQKKGFKSLFKK